MRLLVCLALCALQVVVHAQSDVLTPHSVSLVPVPPGSGTSAAALPTESDVTPHSVSFVPAPVPTTAAATSASRSNKGKIAGAVVGSVAMVVAAIGALVLLRMRARRSKRHWRNRVGTWQDRVGKDQGSVGQPSGRPFDGYSRDTKGSVVSPTTPTAAPLFIREPRIAYPFSSSHRREDSMEMSPTGETTKV